MNAPSASVVDVDTLLEQVLGRPEAEWRSTVDDLCTRHPSAAASLRRRFQLLQRTGMAAPDLRPELLQPGQRFGAYQLCEMVGVGGMGVVFRARRDGLDRDIALKVLRPEFLEHEAARARFLREASAAASVDHPAVCTLHDFGEQAGVPFLAMRFVRGRTLAAGIAEARRTARPDAVLGGGDGPFLPRLMALFAQLSAGLAQVHARGLVHRDVKPDNVLVEPGERPVLIDFGLASAVGATRLTRSGEPLGTPAYMAPEQVRGAEVDARADVYGLAATLYECIALRPPFQVAGREALYRAILEQEVADVRIANPDAPRDLAVVLQKALQKEPARRYATAAEFGEELHRIGRGEPVRARPVSLWRRLLRHAWRRPRQTAVVAVGSLVVSGLWLGQRLVDARSRAESEGLAASTTALLARDVTVGALVARDAYQQVQSEATRSNLLLAMARNLQTGEHRLGRQITGWVPSPDGAVVIGLTDEIWLRDAAGLRRLPDSRLTGQFYVHYNSAAWARDGQSFLAAGYDGSLRRCHRSGTPLPLAEPRFPGTCYTGQSIRPMPLVAALAGGEFVVGDTTGGLRIVAADGTTRVKWSVPAGAQARVVLVAVLADGSTIVSADSTGVVLRWSSPGAEPEVLHRGAEITAVFLARDDRHVAIGDATGGIHVIRIDGASGALCSLDVEDGRAIEALALAPEAAAVFASTTGQHWALWRCDPKPRLLVRQRHRDVVRGADFSPDGDLVAFGDQAGHLTILDRLGREQQEIAAHQESTYLVRFTGARTLMTGAWDGIVREWRLDVPGLPVLHVHDHAVFNLAWLPDGSSLVSSGGDGQVCWTRIDGRRVDSVVYPEGGWVLFGLALAPDGSQVAVVDYNSTVGVQRYAVDSVRGRLLPQRDRIEMAGRALAWGRNDRIGIGARDGRVVSFAPDKEGLLDCRAPGSARAHTWDVYTLAVSPQGLLASASLDGSACLWSADGRLLATLLRVPASVPAIDFAPDGQSVLIGQINGTLLLTDLQGNRLQQFRGVLTNITCAKVAPNGAFVAAVSSDGYLHVWSIGGDPWLRLPQPGLPHALAFSPDSDRIGVTGSDGTIRIWPITTAQIERLAADVFRELTVDERRTWLRR